MTGRPQLPEGPFVVLGLARSGEAAALALRARGQQVLGADAGEALKPALAQAAGRLAAAGVEVQLGAVSGDVLGDARTLVKSPGVPQSAEPVVAARERGLTVIGELELAWRLLPNDFIAVTGTNGKTTTTEWIGHVHRTAGLPVAVGGNVGTALSTMIGELDPAATVVCESSSFQLEDTELFAPQVALLLNITPDHLDRHGTLENYREAKLNVFANQTADDFAVLPDDLDVVVPGNAQELRFGHSAAATLRVGEDGTLRWRGTALLPVSEIRLPGGHNLQNAMATASACLAREINPDAVAEALRTFGGVPHRLELVAQSPDGVRYVNDSKATNVASTLVALSSYERGVHLILGGQGKAQVFDPLAALIEKTCAGVYLIGEDAEQIAADLTAVTVPKRELGKLERAVREATANARPGDVILLSPACASFDQFDSFEQRGDVFRELAQRIAGAQR